MNDVETPPETPEEFDKRTSDERIEDLAFENRIKVLTDERKWKELEAVMLIYGSALDDRFHKHGLIVSDDDPVDAEIVE